MEKQVEAAIMWERASPREFGVNIITEKATKWGGAPEYKMGRSER